MKKGAFKRYYTNAEFRSLFLRKLRQTVHLNRSCSKHKDLQPSRIMKDVHDVESLRTLMNDSWINPFWSEQNSLVNIATAAVAPSGIERDLMGAATCELI